MKSRQKVFTQSTLGFKTVLAFLVLLAAAPVLWAMNPAEEIQKAIVETYEQSSSPAIDPNPFLKEEKKDVFFDKIRRERADFMREEQKRKTKFLTKLRGNRWSDEKKQNEIIKNHQEQMKRQQEFTKKQQKKIDKHLGV